ncbi:hypothetical protein [Streptomyces sp. SID3343]|uniref:hypothetical protein n=1 Tax=Streptomyces sp. SID3343 TaxID=2690260 RepID=UPI00136D07DF|nr:hypothetical protein [Streptomyces sp. SID3343]MYV98531.1 hypothetical protein [Streptomyces sp. SID3343]
MPTFTAQADQLRAAADAFKRELAGLGAPWGNDENGRKFGATFAANQDAIVRGADNLVLGMASIGPTLVAMAENTVTRDQANADLMS